jgi:hypothetical protein
LEKKKPQNIANSILKVILNEIFEIGSYLYFIGIFKVQNTIWLSAEKKTFLFFLFLE